MARDPFALLPRLHAWAETVPRASRWWIDDKRFREIFLEVAQDLRVWDPAWRYSFPGSHVIRVGDVELRPRSDYESRKN